jgi:hypothetical protein
MKSLLLAVALLGTALSGTGLCAPPQPPPRAALVSHPSNSNFPHPRFPRPNFPHPNRNWDHGYWRVHRYGYWNHHRGYWTVQHGRHVFVNHD